MCAYFQALRHIFLSLSLIHISFCQPDVSRSPASNVALRTLQRSFEQLQRELRRKDKALAEAAAILILQKKFQALLEDEDK